MLTATLPTKVGGDNNVLARTMNFEFLRPVLTGDKIICEVTIEKYEKQDNNRISIVASFICTNQNEKQVLRGNFAGEYYKYSSSTAMKISFFNIRKMKQKF